MGFRDCGHGRGEGHVGKGRGDGRGGVKAGPLLTIMIPLQLKRRRVQHNGFVSAEIREL